MISLMAFPRIYRVQVTNEFLSAPHISVPVKVAGAFKRALKSRTEVSHPRNKVTTLLYSKYRSVEGDVFSPVSIRISMAKVDSVFLAVLAGRTRG